LESGRERSEIERLVVAHFGDPRQIADGFSQVYRHERWALRALAFALSVLGLAGSLLGAILAAQTGLALAFGRPILNIVASRHTVIEALDILASVVVYLATVSLESLFRSQPFLKAAAIVSLTALMLSALFAVGRLNPAILVFGLINAMFCRSLQVLLVSSVARMGATAICFPLVGILLSLQRSPISHSGMFVTCVSWLLIGVGYQLMAHLAARFDSAVLNGLQRLQWEFPIGGIK
jgi:hypothetical protein